MMSKKRPTTGGKKSAKPKPSESAASPVGQSISPGMEVRVEPSETIAPAPTTETRKVVCESRTVTVPYIDLVIGYVSDRCDVKSLSQAQRVTLRKIANGLMDKQAKLKNGKKVANTSDAIKWMLESI